MANGQSNHLSAPPSTKLGRAESAVYHLIRTGNMDPIALAALYPRELRALAAAGLVRREVNGAYVPTGSGEQPALQVPEPMQTVTARISAEDAAALDALGYETRSEAIRAVLHRGLEVLSGSSARRRAAG